MPAPFVFVAVVVATLALIIFFGAWAVAADAEGRTLTFGLAATAPDDAGTTQGGDASTSSGQAAFGVAPIGETSEGAADRWWGQAFLKACPLH